MLNGVIEEVSSIKLRAKPAKLLNGTFLPYSTISEDEVFLIKVIVVFSILYPVG